MAKPQTVDELKKAANELRGIIKRVGDQVQGLKGLVKETGEKGAIPADPPIDFGEAIANAVLSFRHLEDARMRLGKLIQALDGGVSIFDREPQQQQG
jgi:hypothetical protein